MKVFNLHCSQGHVFEGWFESEDSFRYQAANALLECPICGSTGIEKGLSAPRLNLGAQNVSREKQDIAAVQTEDTANAKLRAVQAAWLMASREIAAQTEDVGARFTEEALQMHYGELPSRPIRGQASPQQVENLLDEGVPVLPLVLPVSSKETLQ